VRLAAQRAPAAVGHADVEAAVGAVTESVDAALEAAAEREARPLVLAVHLLQVDAHDVGLVLVADEALAGEGAELAAGGVPHRLPERLAHAAVGEPHHRRRVRRQAAGAAGTLLAVVEHAAVVRLRGGRGERRLLDPAQPGGGAGIVAFADVLELARRHPLALVVGVEQVAVRAGGDAGGRAQAGGEGLEFALRRDLDAPAAPGRLGLVAAAEADVERHEEVALLVAGRAEGELVVIAGHAPPVADGDVVLDRLAVLADEFG